jgi:2-C-methyl-D-erythritol 4-phosphate cytidylyltransferase
VRHVNIIGNKKGAVVPLTSRYGRTGAIIVAAGESRRMGKDKIFLPLAGKPLIAWSVDVCHHFEPITQVVLVLNEYNAVYGKKLVVKNNWNKVVEICTGGQRRQDSVKAGLSGLKSCDWVIIHDGARPFLTVDLLKNGIESAQKTGAAVAAVPVKDTIKITDINGIVEKTLERQNLWTVQTPQMFRFDIISRTYTEMDDDVTDDAMLVEKMGYKISLYMGSYSNIKVTTPEDMALAEIIAKGNIK